jgi:replication-associated recombination protein RarA
MKTHTFKNYDPQTINDIVFASPKSQSLMMDIVSGARPFPNAGKTGILFYGPPGTGKSALAKMLPDAMEMVRTGYPSDYVYYPVSPGANGMSILANIQSQAQTYPSASHHYFVLDEVDELTDQAMAILKSVLNTQHAIFVMTTNHINDIDQAVQDRCHCIPFLAAASHKWLPLAHRMLADAEITTISDQALIKVIDQCNGSARQIVDELTTLILTVQRKNQAINSIIP